MAIKVFKFGGASLETVERIRGVGDIISGASTGPLLVVISALGKTTNALERVAEHYYLRKRGPAAEQLHAIRQAHADIAAGLLGAHAGAWMEDTKRFFNPIEWLMGEKPSRPFDFYYDQIVSLGELLSSSLVSHYLTHSGVSNRWVDARRIILTDDHFREGNINWELAAAGVASELLPALQQERVVVTQGFIGSTEDQHATTLGREGSDYSAAVLANLLDATSLTIWKDVEGLKNADPKLFPDTVLISSISYTEVIEMAYYGAQVIHPKTIKPLQNKKIPLYVRCFLDKDLPGTLIQGTGTPAGLPPLIILKKDQVLLTLGARDFSFITEEKIARLFAEFHSHRIHINLVQNTAISFSTCIDQDVARMDQLIKGLRKEFTVTFREGLELLTIRHYNTTILENLTRERDIILEQRSPLTVQIMLARK